MSSADGAEPTRDERGEQPPRRGMPWTEEDFAGVMRAARDGCDHDEIADRIGRSPIGLRGQLRRLLPVEERHLPVHLVLPRLRQLDRDGDYDWLAAMARPTKSRWELEREAQAERDERGIGVLSDEEVVGLAQAVGDCSARLPSELVRAIATAVQRRGLAAIVRRRALAAADDAVDALLRRGNGPWADEFPICPCEPTG